jgi:hypothetical protein
MTDVVTLAGTGGSSFNTPGQFGAIYKEASHFATLQNDGLWGLGYQPLSKITPFFDSMVSAGVPDIFSMCLSTPRSLGKSPTYYINHFACGLDLIRSTRRGIGAGRNQSRLSNRDSTIHSHHSQKLLRCEYNWVVRWWKYVLSLQV